LKNKFGFQVFFHISRLGGNTVASRVPSSTQLQVHPEVTGGLFQQWLELVESFHFIMLEAV
jgi:hypothetical protein